MLDGVEMRNTLKITRGNENPEQDNQNPEQNRVVARRKPRWFQ